MTDESTKHPIEPIASYTVYDYGEGDDTLKLAVRAGAMHMSIWELLNDVLRPVCKHGNDTVQVNHYEKVKEEMWEILRENGIADLF